MNKIIETLDGAADGAFVVDDELRIHIWNEAAEEILGFSNGEVEGQLCYQVLQGHDEEMRLFCKAYCQVSQSVLKDEPVSNYDVHALTNMGDRRWLNMSVLTSKTDKNGSKKMIIHLFRDVSQKKNDEIFFHQLLETARRYHKIPLELDEKRNTNHHIKKLTGREREVLTLLAHGHSTQEIAETLSISRNTSRNHIQRILQKLQLHSRLEAVTYALRNGLLG